VTTFGAPAARAYRGLWAIGRRLSMRGCVRSRYTLAFSEIELKRIEAVVGPLCGRRSPAHAHHQVRTEYRVEDQGVLIVEVRVVWDDPSRWMEHGVAKLKFNRKAGEWRLFWQRASLRWESYEPLASSRDLAILVEEIDRDPNGCFFG
jgi:hypothetical protein